MKFLVNKWESVLLESAPFFCTFVDANKAVLQRGKVP